MSVKVRFKVKKKGRTFWASSESGSYSIDLLISSPIMFSSSPANSLSSSPSPRSPKSPSELKRASRDSTFGVPFGGLPSPRSPKSPNELRRASRDSAFGVAFGGLPSAYIPFVSEGKESVNKIINWLEDWIRSLWVYSPPAWSYLGTHYHLKTDRLPEHHPYLQLQQSLEVEEVEEVVLSLDLK